MSYKTYAPGQDPNTEYPNFTFANKPTAAVYGVGYAHIAGIPYYSDGSTWKALEVPYFANASAVPTAAQFGAFAANVGGVTYLSGGASTSAFPVGWTRMSGGVYVLAQATGGNVIEPAATFTTVSVADNAGNAQLTSAGVHGLTTGVAVGKSIYVSAGTNWTSGFYGILSVDDTTSITIDLAYDETLGSPTIALANTEVTLATVTIPAGVLGTTGRLVVNDLWEVTNSANNKVTDVKLSTTSIGEVTLTTVDSQLEQRHVWNTAVDAQVFFAGPASFGSVATAVSTGAVDTSSAVSLTFTAKPAAENEFVELKAYSVEIHR